MQVSCPKCKTRYHAGPEVIEAFGGIVRCGECDDTFNIHDQIEPVLLDRKDQIKPAPALDAKVEADEGAEEKHSQIGHQTRIEPRFSEVELDQNLFESHALDHIEEADSDNESKPDAAMTPIKDESEPDEIWKDTDTFTIDTFDLSREDRGLSDREPTLKIDAEDNENISEYASYQQLKRPNVALTVLGRFFAFIFWAALALGLTFLLFGQIKQRLYPAYKNHPVVENVRSFICQKVPCADLESHVGSFEIVISRMDEVTQPTRQLHVSIFLLNKAEIALAYPNIEITLKRLDGSTVGQRVLTSAQYSTSLDSMAETSSNDGARTKWRIQPSKMERITIKFDNPPTDAVGFEARIVP